MKVSTKCKHCKAEIILKGRYNDRGELRREVGETVAVHCTECLAPHSIPVSSFYATEAKAPAFIVGGLALMCTLFLCKWLFPYALTAASPDLFFVGLIPVGVFVIYGKQQWEAVRRFNDYR